MEPGWAEFIQMVYCIILIFYVLLGWEVNLTWDMIKNDNDTSHTFLCVMIIKVRYDASSFLLCFAIFNRTFRHISCLGLSGSVMVNAFVFLLLYLKSRVHFLPFLPLVSGGFEFLEVFLRLQQFHWTENHIVIFPLFVFDLFENVQRAPGIDSFPVMQSTIIRRLPLSIKSSVQPTVPKSTAERLYYLIPSNQPILFFQSFISMDNFLVIYLK